MGGYKNFGGKRYMYVSNWRTKGQANEDADRLRKVGYKVRVTKYPTYFDGKKVHKKASYDVWVHPCRVDWLEKAGF